MKSERRGTDRRVWSWLPNANRIFVLLDVEMPVLNGPEMSYRMFIHDLGQEEIPLVLLSGVTNLLQVAETVGTPYFLPKPCAFDAIAKLVTMGLVERRAPVPRDSNPKLSV